MAMLKNAQVEENILRKRKKKCMLLIVFSERLELALFQEMKFLVQFKNHSTKLVERLNSKTIAHRRSSLTGSKKTTNCHFVNRKNLMEEELE